MRAVDLYDLHLPGTLSLAHTQTYSSPSLQAFVQHQTTRNFRGLFWSPSGPLHPPKTHIKQQQSKPLRGIP